MHFGAGRDLAEASHPLIMEKGAIKVGLIGVCHHEGKVAELNAPGPLSEVEREIIARQIRELRARVDWVVVNYHGGEEYTFFPSPRKRRLLLQYLEDGADIVVSHHPHVIQPYETINGKAAFYSLGNFLLDLEWFGNKTGTRESAVLRLDFSKKDWSFDHLITELNPSAKQIGVLSNTNRFQILNHETYEAQWCQDAFRLVRSFFDSGIEVASGPNKSDGPCVPWLSKLWDARFVFGILKSPGYRSVLAGAFKHVIKSKLGILTGRSHRSYL